MMKLDLFFWMRLASFCLFCLHGSEVKANDPFSSFMYYPQRGDEVCAVMIQEVYDAYPQFEMICDCSGILITDPTSGTIIPLGDFFINCLSENFFTSPDGKVWWYLYWMAEFNEGLHAISQKSTYVRGRKYDDISWNMNDLYREKFIYLRKDPDKCVFSISGQTGLFTKCQTCERVNSTNPNVAQDALCYKMDCTNTANLLGVYGGDFVVEDTCSVPMPITDFANQPMAASLGFLEDNVQQVYFPGGAACISPLTRVWDILGDDMECTCENNYDDVNEGEVAVFVSCKYPCTYGPESGEVEWNQYAEFLFKHTSLLPNVMDEGGQQVWWQLRYEYTKGRQGNETYREEQDASSCSVTRSDDVTCDCSLDSNDVQLVCTNGDSFVFVRDSPEVTEEAWTTMPFAARWKEGSTCLLPDSEPVSSGPTPAPAPYVLHTTGGCLSRNELGVTSEATVRDCAALCDAAPTCVSFEYQNSGSKCQLSTSCDRYDWTVKDPGNEYNWYLKGDLSESDGRGYNAYFSGGCIGQNELGTSSEATLQNCSSLCDALPDCVSFEYQNSGSTCQLSSSCSSFDMTVKEQDDVNNWYVKTALPASSTAPFPPTAAPSMIPAKVTPNPTVPPSMTAAEVALNPTAAPSMTAAEVNQNPTAAPSMTAAEVTPNPTAASFPDDSAAKTQSDLSSGGCLQGMFWLGAATVMANLFFAIP